MPTETNTAAREPWAATGADVEARRSEAISPGGRGPVSYRAPTSVSRSHEGPQEVWR